MKWIIWVILTIMVTIVLAMLVREDKISDLIAGIIYFVWQVVSFVVVASIDD